MRGLLLSAPLPLKSVSLTGNIDHFLSILTLTHVFEVDTHEEWERLPEECVFRLVWPDFCSQILAFEFVHNGSVVQALPTTSKWLENDCYRKAAPSSSPNVFTAVLEKLKRVELVLRFLTPLRAYGDRWQLQVPLQCCEYYIHPSSPQQTTNNLVDDSSNIHFDFIASIAVSLPHEFHDIISDTHTIRFDPEVPRQSHLKEVNSSNRLKGMITVYSSSTIYSPLNDLIIQFSSTLKENFAPYMIVETPQDEETGYFWKKAAMIIARPQWFPIITQGDITILIDSCNLDEMAIGKEVKEMVKREFEKLPILGLNTDPQSLAHPTTSTRQSNHSTAHSHSHQSPQPSQSAPFNICIITRYGPQWALPKPMPLSSDLISKFNAFVDSWPSLLAKQGRRDASNFSLARSLSIINSRPSDYDKHVIFVSTLALGSHETVDQCIAASQTLRIWSIGFGPSHASFSLQLLSNATDARYEHSYTLSTFSLALSSQLNRAKSTSLSHIRLSLLPNPTYPPIDLLSHHLCITPHFAPKSCLSTPQDVIQFFIGFRPSFFDHGFHTQLTALDFEIKADFVRHIGSQEVTREVEFQPSSVHFSLPLESSSMPQSSANSNFVAAFTHGKAVQLACGLEYVLDLEESISISEPYLQLCDSLSIPHLNAHFFARDFMPNIGKVTLFNIADSDYYSQALQSRSHPNGARSTAALSDSNSFRIVRDLESLLMVKKTVDKSSKPFGALSLLPSSHPESSVPSHTASKLTSKKQNRTPVKQRTRPVLTIQSCWASSAILLEAVPTKPMQQYDVEFKSMNSILNKVTAENLERLGSKLISDAFCADSYALSSLARLIYDKAVRQQTYAPLYAELVRFLMHKHGENGEIIRRAVLDHCRNEFEVVLEGNTKILEEASSSSPSSSSPSPVASSLPSPSPLSVPSSSPIPIIPVVDHPPPSLSPSIASSESTTKQRPRFFNSKMGTQSLSASLSSSPSLSSPSPFSLSKLRSLTEDAEEKENKAKEQRVGLIVFLSKLFKRGLLSIDITQNCIGELFIAALKADPHKCNELLVLAIKYISIVGKYIQQANSPVIERTFQYIDSEVLAEIPHLDTRTKTLFQNLIDLKDNHWIPREVNGDLRKSTW